MRTGPNHAIEQALPNLRHSSIGVVCEFLDPYGYVWTVHAMARIERFWPCSGLFCGFRSRPGSPGHSGVRGVCRSVAGERSPPLRSLAPGFAPHQDRSSANRTRITRPHARCGGRCPYGTLVRSPRHRRGWRRDWRRGWADHGLSRGWSACRVRRCLGDSRGEWWVGSCPAPGG